MGGYLFLVVPPTAKAGTDGGFARTRVVDLSEQPCPAISTNVGIGGNARNWWLLAPAGTALEEEAPQLALFDGA